jgi:DNA-binding HxlR family transcriptional regulator
MPITYGEYCPIAVGAEFFADRWTPLVLRELIMGSTQFNQIQRGIPRISRTVLSQRLRQLQERGIVDKREWGPGRPVEYRLTPAGADLEPIVISLGLWAARWALREPSEDQLDASWFIWHLHQFIDTDAIPAARTCILFDLRGQGGGHRWIVLDRGGSTACHTDPGYEVDLVVRADNRAAHRWFLGRTTLREAQREGSIAFEGPRELVRAFPTWFTDTPFNEEMFAQRKETEGLLPAPA